MLRAFSTAATGMDAQQTMVDVIAHNLANVSTNGFKRSQVNFQDLLYLKMRQADREVSSGITAPSGVEVGSGVKIASTARVFSPGSMESSGNDLDIAIQGEGFFQVTLPSGELRYTRDGAFQKDSNGYVVTANGYHLSPGITIPQDAMSVDVGADGTVTVQTPSGVQVVGMIELYRFANPAGLSAEGENLFKETEASGAAIAGQAGLEGYGTLLSRYLEKSNVQMVQELVNLITAQRGYEINSRCIRTGDNMLQQLNQLIR
ncbi:MAG TPA: flagellar basal-body rod protein FlgG [Anaerohalosphaeraceae bacterium]|jgi:flagellar basal-body rod protein FlgG|nr:flagellar basal-body rod protein FlgG [Anaerohalosphaeraceae bacterium]